MFMVSFISLRRSPEMPVNLLLAFSYMDSHQEPLAYICQSLAERGPGAEETKTVHVRKRQKQVHRHLRRSSQRDERNHEHAS
jgi:hypothetical protein